MTAAVHTLNCSFEDDFKEWNNQAEDQPDVDHLHVRGGGQFLWWWPPFSPARQSFFLAGEDGGYHQHDGKVHSNDIPKQVKEDSGEGDEEQEDGGEVGGQQFHGNLPLQLHSHVQCTPCWHSYPVSGIGSLSGSWYNYVRPVPWKCIKNWKQVSIKAGLQAIFTQETFARVHEFVIT